VTKTSDLFHLGNFPTKDGLLELKRKVVSADNAFLYINFLLCNFKVYV